MLTPQQLRDKLRGPVIAMTTHFREDYSLDLDGVRRRYLPIDWCEHEALIRLGASVLSLGGVSRQDYMRFFRYYIGFLGLPESRDRVLRKALWRRLSGQVVKAG